MSPRAGVEAPHWYRAPLAGDLDRLSFCLVSTTFPAVSFVIVTFLRLALVSIVSRLRWFRFHFFGFAFGVWFWVLFCAVVSCVCLVIRVCHTATTLLN